MALDTRVSFHYSLTNETVKMEILANILGTISGLRFVTAALSPAEVITTAIAMQITYAIIARVLAAQSGRAPFRWLVAGFAGGVIAILALLILDDRAPNDET